MPTAARSMIARSMPPPAKRRKKRVFLIPSPPQWGAGSDFSGLNFAGVRSLLVGYPVRTAKAPTSVMAKNDVTALENLLSALLPRLAKGEK